MNGFDAQCAPHHLVVDAMCNMDGTVCRKGGLLRSFRHNAMHVVKKKKIIHMHCMSHAAITHNHRQSEAFFRILFWIFPFYFVGSPIYRSVLEACERAISHVFASECGCTSHPFVRVWCSNIALLFVCASILFNHTDLLVKRRGSASGMNIATHQRRSSVINRLLESTMCALNNHCRNCHSSSSSHQIFHNSTMRKNYAIFHLTPSYKYAYMCVYLSHGRLFFYGQTPRQ